MKMRTGPTNEQLKGLITELRKKAYSDSGNIMLWRRIAADLERPSRNRRAVNLSRISRYTKSGETVIVPGKVLSSGMLDKSITIAAWQFSQQAVDKIAKANAKALSISELMQMNPEGKNVRIIG
ncbi:50S ribosomal protein L18e [Candidatus Woesearchaeota archaeon]|nr:50S ribosomal protein L18e [Candidatus Woesearchaeota archaeon]